MDDSVTLLAYLVPRITRQVENAATDALGHILNRSEASRDALRRQIQGSGFELAPIARVETQIAYEDGSRPDMVGYDQEGGKRLLVEAKFWATLLRGQASGYIEQFDEPGVAVLVFIAPAARIETLWIEIRRQFGEERKVLEHVRSSAALCGARVAGTNRGVMLTSWRQLLDGIAAVVGDASVASDISQLRGLTEHQDETAFLPVHAEDLSPEFRAPHDGLQQTDQRPGRSGSWRKVDVC